MPIKHLTMKKNASVFNLLLTTVVFLLLSACKKSLTDSQTDSLPGTSNRNSTLTPLGTTPDVYVAGSDGGKAVYWKNGTEVVLPGGLMATGIVAIGTNVYVCGYGSGPVAQYWLNGVLTNLSDGTNPVMASGIAVSGTDVYIAGTEGLIFRTAVYWKNGVATSLGLGVATGIAVSTSGDVYVSNSATASSGPTYWENGTLETLPGDASSYLNAIAVQGSNVYAVGADGHGTYQTALYWLNGVSQTLSTSVNTDALAVAVTATGQPVISGTTGQNGDLQIGYWSGGDLSTLSSGEFVSTSTGVAVDASGNIYVCGSQYNTVSTPPSVAWNWEISSTGSVTSSQLSDGSVDATAHAITLGQ